MAIRPLSRRASAPLRCAGTMPRAGGVDVLLVTVPTWMRPRPRYPFSSSSSVVTFFLFFSLFFFCFVFSPLLRAQTALRSRFVDHHSVSNSLWTLHRLESTPMVCANPLLRLSFSPTDFASATASSPRHAAFPRWIRRAKSSSMHLWVVRGAKPSNGGCGGVSVCEYVCGVDRLFCVSLTITLFLSLSFLSLSLCFLLSLFLSLFLLSLSLSFSTLSLLFFLSLSSCTSLQATRLVVAARFAVMRATIPGPSCTACRAIPNCPITLCPCPTIPSTRASV